MLPVRFGKIKDVVYNTSLFFKNQHDPKWLEDEEVQKMPGRLFNASNCGDNCAEWLLKIGESTDVTINLRHIMDFGDQPFAIHIVNTDQVVRDMDSLARIAGRFV